MEQVFIVGGETTITTIGNIAKDRVTYHQI